MNATNKKTLKQTILNIIPIFMVLIVSLSLLVYVGYGAANKTYTQMEIEKDAAIGELAQNSIDSFLISGLSLKQFVGFSTISTPLVESEKNISCMQASTLQNKILFNAGKTLDNNETWRESRLTKEGAKYIVLENNKRIRIQLSLSNKFEKVGYLFVDIIKDNIKHEINSYFIYVIIGMLIISILFIIIMIIINNRKLKNEKTLLQVIYGSSFVLMSVIVIITLVSLYSGGIQQKTRALANTLGQRINSIFELGLDLEDIDGLDKMFVQYQKLNPDLSYIALIKNDKISIHTDKKKIGTKQETSKAYFEYKMGLESPYSLSIDLGIPKKVIYITLIRSIKNFLVLFIASAFLSYLFLSLFLSYRHKKEYTAETTEKSIRNNFLLGLIRPLYFLSIFVEGLMVPFLPQYFKSLAQGVHLSQGAASILFTIYFAAFVITLIPSGIYADKKGVKSLMFTGALFYLASYVMMIFVSNFYILFAVRTLAGIGQGMLFIGVQSYILKMASVNKKTQGTSIIVFGYNGGMVSGMAIGALLATYLDIKFVFLIAASVAVFSAIYILTIIPQIQINKKSDNKNNSGNIKDSLKNVSLLIKDFDFVKTIMLIGIVTKAVLTGVTIFALPLLMASKHFLQEDIGQILLLYAAGVLISTAYISKLTDRLQKTGPILFIGSLGSGIGLILIGFLNYKGLNSIPILQTIFLMVGMLILGLSHGFIHAPIVTHISNTQAAQKIGVGAATSIYRFLERIGHVIGPLIVGQILFSMHNSSLSISWIGASVIILGILFIILNFGTYKKNMSIETKRS